MAEFEALSPNDPTEAAFREALLGDDAGREQRRVRLMAALPRPPAPVEAVPAARGLLVGRWQPVALVLLATGVLIAAVLMARTSPSVGRAPALEPQASAPVVVAQALPAAALPAPAALPQPVAPGVAAKARHLPPVVVAEAAAPPPPLDIARPEVAGAVVAAPSAQAAPVVPAAAAVVAAPVTQAAAPSPSPAPVVSAAAPVVVGRTAVAELDAPLAQAGRLERVDVVGSRANALAASPQASSLAASNAVAEQAIRDAAVANARLSRAVGQLDAQAVREALQAGASTQLRDAQGRTPLMQAARAGAAPIVDLLLAAGASKADRDTSGWTAADHAQDQGHTELAARLR
ncbi:ankyrin repeat domain-containing protein [Roseateles sp. BYS96W]|uniref:Ankyrin repeat domain-containing protein n=1 Tax=Pelomonas nitida TaxID=3299027 RepID=A0ABW7GCA6_9BURK